MLNTYHSSDMLQLNRDVALETDNSTVATALDSTVGTTYDSTIATRDSKMITPGATTATQEPSAEKDRGISDGLRLKTLACVGSSNKHDLESKTCAKMCAKARTTAPR